MKTVEYYVKGLFRNIKRTKEIDDQIEELTCHISDRVGDLVFSGMNEDEAIEKTINGLSDLDELIDTVSGKKIRLPIYKLDFIMMFVGMVYGAIYLFFTTICINKWYFGSAALYLTVPAFAGYVIPFLFACIKYIANPKKTVLKNIPTLMSFNSSVIGWLLISSICIIANILMYKLSPSIKFWAWMPVAGVFTWPLMEIVMYGSSKQEGIKRTRDAFN